MPAKGKKGALKKKVIPIKVDRCINNFINTGNATQSYIDAGYSKNGASQAARNLLIRPYVIELIAERRAKIAKNNEITADKIINEYAKIAFVNSKDFFKWEKQTVVLSEGVEMQRGVAILKTPEEITDDQKAAIQSIKETTQGIELKLFDKVKSLIELGKYVGINNKAEIGKAKAINKNEMLEPHDPCEGMTEEELDQALDELDPDGNVHKIVDKMKQIKNDAKNNDPSALIEDRINKKMKAQGIDC